MMDGGNLAGADCVDWAVTGKGVSFGTESVPRETRDRALMADCASLVDPNSVNSGAECSQASHRQPGLARYCRCRSENTAQIRAAPLPM